MAYMGSGRVETTVSTNGLIIKRTTPSATTVKYTISNKPSSKTLFSLFRTVLRIFATYLFVVAVARRTWSFSSIPIALLQDFAVTIEDRIMLRSTFVYSLNDDFEVVAASILLLWTFWNREYTEDSILILHDFGIQLSSTGTTILSRSSQFIPLELIQDVILHEGFHGLGVIYFLAVVVKDRERLLVVFPNLLPKRAVLEDIWRDIRRCLYQQPTSISIGKDTYTVRDTVQITDSKQWRM
ncbi:GPI-GlcNAc transferase complex, PIG-H component-domain-containing protein [Lipomyces arxii]|uniref:GPI-GlcNAc transferase complex, PIG-H component-domain-containing protein n=1 Tax=Lipomyces arxii TaxID=56418 RepID=UPI0034CF0AB1